MWEFPALERRTAADLDFSSAGLGRRQVTRLVGGSVVFANAIELTAWDGRDVQVIVCEQCGSVHCQPGGWLGPRRAGDYVVFAPDSRLLHGNEHDRNEYRPPEYVRNLGWPFTTRAGYEGLRASVPGLPAHDQLFALTRRDVVAICQWEAPAAVLGRPFEHPALRRDLLLAADGDVEQLSAALAECRASWAASEAPVVLARDATAPAIFVDVPRAPNWRLLASVDGWSLLLRASPGTTLTALVDLACQVRPARPFRKPAVVGAVIQLGNCFDLLDTASTAQLAQAHAVFVKSLPEGTALPTNSGKTPDRKLRRLDCVVLNFYFRALEEAGRGYDSVRGAFIEGDAAFEGSDIKKDNHIQIAVRNPACVLGVFRPRSS